MRQNPSFQKILIQNEIWLLPVGQAVSDHKSALKLNDTGAYLWELLSTDRTVKELCALSAEHFDIPESQLSGLQTDILNFLDLLNDRGMLLAPLPLPAASDKCLQTLSIAGLILKLYGPAEAFASAFEPFELPARSLPDRPADQNLFVLYGSPAIRENGCILLRNKELTVVCLEEKYILSFHADSRVHELHLKKDGSVAYFYCIPGETLREDLFHAMRFAFLYLAQLRGILAIHSASVLYRDRAWLFSAPSGTGKSTHAALWHDILGAPYLNGDLNLITSDKGTPVVHGLPWCGTSGISDTGTHPLGGILFLKQAASDSALPLEGSDRVLALSRRLVSPCWDADMLQRQITLSKELSEKPFLCRLLCTPKKSALDAARQAVDRYLDAYTESSSISCPFKTRQV